MKTLRNFPELNVFGQHIIVPKYSKSIWLRLIKCTNQSNLNLTFFDEFTQQLIVETVDQNEILVLSPENYVTQNDI